MENEISGAHSDKVAANTELTELCENLDQLMQKLGFTGSAIEELILTISQLDAHFADINTTINSTDIQASLLSNELISLANETANLSEEEKAGVKTFEKLVDALKAVGQGSDKGEKSTTSDFEPIINNVKEMIDNSKYIHSVLSGRSQNATPPESSFGEGVSSGAGLLLDGLPEVAVATITDFAAKKIGDYISFHDAYVNATPDTQFEMNKNRALDNVKELNSVWGKFMGVLSQYHDRELIEGGTLSYGVGDLVTQYPQVLQDQKYINETRRILDIYGDKNLINIVKSYGFTKENEKPRTLTVLPDMGYKPGHNFILKDALEHTKNKTITKPFVPGHSADFINSHANKLNFFPTTDSPNTNSHHSHNLTHNLTNNLAQTATHTFPRHITAAPSLMPPANVTNVTNHFSINVAGGKDSVTDVKKALQSVLRGAVNDSEIH